MKKKITSIVITSANPSKNEDAEEVKNDKISINDTNGVSDINVYINRSVLYDKVNLDELDVGAQMSGIILSATCATGKTESSVMSKMVSPVDYLVHPICTAIKVEYDNGDLIDITNVNGSFVVTLKHYASLPPVPQK